MHTTPPPTHQTPTPNPRMGSKVQNYTFSEHDHVAYQHEWISNAAAWYKIFCPQTPLTLEIGSKGQNSPFLNMVMFHIKLNGITNTATW